jgi:hypothetical protein
MHSAMRGPPEWRSVRLFSQRRRGTVPAPGRGMIDFVLVLLTVAFFGLAWGYARLCEKL